MAEDRFWYVLVSSTLRCGCGDLFVLDFLKERKLGKNIRLIGGKLIRQFWWNRDPSLAN